MATESRHERLAAELAAMRALRKASRILEFECRGDHPDRYLVRFHGRSLRHRANAPFWVEFINRHEVEIRLPPHYPHCPPDMRWLTPIFHPNVSRSGLLTFRDIGLSWNRDLGLDVICERLWDLARCQYLDLAHASNAAAQTFFLRKHGIRLPLDSRSLGGAGGPSDAHLPCQPWKTVVADGSANPWVIDDESPAPDAPIRFVPSWRRPAISMETIYIGDD